MKKNLPIAYYPPISLARLLESGAIAQLGERLTGSQEVVGSIPSSSIEKAKAL